MTQLYDAYDNDDEGFVITAAERRSRKQKTVPAPKRSSTSQSYSRSHNRPAVFNGIHRRRHKKFNW